MDEKDLKLLRFALLMGEKAIDEVYDIAEYCETLSDDYFYMKEKLAKLLGVDYDVISD